MTPTLIVIPDVKVTFVLPVATAMLLTPSVSLVIPIPTATPNPFAVVVDSAKDTAPPGSSC